MLCSAHIQRKHTDTSRDRGTEDSRDSGVNFTEINRFTGWISCPYADSGQSSGPFLFYWSHQQRCLVQQKWDGVYDQFVSKRCGPGRNLLLIISAQGGAQSRSVGCAEVLKVNQVLLRAEEAADKNGNTRFLDSVWKDAIGWHQIRWDIMVTCWNVARFKNWTKSTFRFLQASVIIKSWHTLILIQIYLCIDHLIQPH